MLSYVFLTYVVEFHDLLMYDNGLLSFQLVLGHASTPCLWFVLDARDNKRRKHLPSFLPGQVPKAQVAHPAQDRRHAT